MPASERPRRMRVPPSRTRRVSSGGCGERVHGDDPDPVPPERHNGRPVPSAHPPDHQPPPYVAAIERGPQRTQRVTRRQAHTTANRAPRPARSAASDLEFEADMRRDKAEPLVEPVSAGPRPVRGQLDEPASPPVRLTHGPPEHLLTDSRSTRGMVNPHGLDDRAGCPPPGQAWDKRELKGADNHVTGDCRHHEELVRVPLKNREGGLV